MGLQGIGHTCVLVYRISKEVWHTTLCPTNDPLEKVQLGTISVPYGDPIPELQWAIGF